LLTGKEPQNLYDSYQGTWRWGTDIKVSQGLEKILKKMVAYKPSDRYQNAEQVIKDLQKLSPASTPTVNKVNTNITKLKTMIAAPAKRAGSLHSRTQMAVQALPLPMWMRPFAVSAVTTTAIVLVCAGTWGVVNAVVKGVSSISLPNISLPSLPGGNSDSAEGTGSNNGNRNGDIASRRASLQIPEGFFIQTVDYIFYSKNPQLRGKNLSTGAEDEALRQEWLSIGQDLLDKLEQAKLSSNARQKLGRYGGRDYQEWEQRASSGDFGNYTIRQLNSDTNRKFDELFPGQRRGKLNQPTFGQIWYAIAADKVSKLEAGN
jgi:serine/threonine-protein kinase